MVELDARRAFLLSNSATVIQKHTKTHFSRKRYIALQKSSVFLQSICRCQLFVFFVLCERQKAFVSALVLPCDIDDSLSVRNLQFWYLYLIVCWDCCNGIHNVWRSYTILVHSQHA